jgi:hypothetical protein
MDEELQPDVKRLQAEHVRSDAQWFAACIALQHKQIAQSWQGK